jgi:hypothetical protein
MTEAPEKPMPSAWRVAVAILAAGGTAAVLGGIWGFSYSHALVGDTVVITIASCVVGLFLGIDGVCSRSPYRAYVTGMLMSGICMGFPCLLVSSLAEPPLEKLWFLAATCSFGGICAHVSATIAVPWINTQDANRVEKVQPPMQWSIGQILSFVIPIAVYFGYVGHLMQK